MTDVWLTKGSKLQDMTLVSDLASSHDSIPSPQCALGTTPHLSIRKKAREGRKESREIKKREAGRKMYRKRQQMWRMSGGKKEKQRDNRTLLQHRKRKHVTPSTIKRPEGWFEEMKVNQEFRGEEAESYKSDAELNAVEKVWTQNYKSNNQTFKNNKSRTELTHLALITVTHRVLGSREEGWGRTGGKMEGCEDELHMFGKAARSWQRMNMTSTLVDQTLLCLTHTHTHARTPTEYKHAKSTRQTQDALIHTHTQKHTPGFS